MTPRKRRPHATSSQVPDPYLDAWRALSPFERLRRSWKLRKRLRDPQAVHDEKTLPKL
jgi:hypothetical protein